MENQQPSTIGETDVFVKFGQGQPLFIGGVQMNRSMFIVGVNQLCKGIPFYKVVRDDRDNSIHFIQTKEVSIVFLQKLLNAIIAMVRKQNGNLEASAYRALWHETFKALEHAYPRTIILPPKDVFYKIVNIEIPNEGKYEAIFTNPLELKAMENRILHEGWVLNDRWVIPNSMYYFLKHKSDAVYRKPDYVRKKFHYEEISSHYKNEFVRIPSHIWNKKELALLWKTVLKTPEQSAWKTLEDKMKRDEFIRVVTDIENI